MSWNMEATVLVLYSTSYLPTLRCVSSKAVCLSLSLFVKTYLDIILQVFALLKPDYYRLLR